jgi:hexosaminidase
MLDVARAFPTPSQVRRLVDLAALYKLNVLHLHLTDNDGWRLEIPGLPALTDPAAGGTAEHWTTREYAELQRYAAERFVTVVPEIDLPGHCAAALRACPELGTVPRPARLDPRVPYGPPLDPGSARTREFVRHVLTEVCRMTSGPFVHIGGDEVLGMEPAGFTAAVRLARGVVRSCGKRPLGWQESARAGVEREDIGQFWVDVPMMDLPTDQKELDERPELLAAGFTMEFVTGLGRFFAPADEDVPRIVRGGGKVLLSPQSHAYLDRPYDPAFAPPGLREAARRLGFHYRPRGVRHAAAWDPAAHGVPEEQVAGVEATLFGESVRDFTDVTLLLLPRLLSVAEAAWSPAPPDWPGYRARLAAQAPLWRARGLAAFLSTEVPWA